ncbi:MAG: di/tripeptidase [Gammaproteobacteria bacterium]|jgi:di/tripeptidase
MKISSCYKSLLIYVFLIASSVIVQAEENLVFPASSIEKEEHRYQIAPDRLDTVDAEKLVDAEYLARTLLELLKQPSKSCRETANTQKAKEILEIVGKPLGIETRIDLLVAKVEKLSAERKASVYCDSGKTAPESGNLIAFIPGNISAPSWNLSFHLDTNQLSFDTFTRDGDIIKPAPGTPLGADDKAGIAIVAEILRMIASHNLPHGDIRIVGLVAEEDSAVGAELVEAEAFKGDILVSIDGTNENEIGRAAPSMYNGYFTVATQTSHPAEVDEKQSVSACALGAEILRKSGFRPNAHPPGHPNVVLHSYFTSCGLNKGLETAKGEPVASYQYNTISPYWTAAWQMRNLEGHAAAQKMVDEIASTMKRLCAKASEGRSKVECVFTGGDSPKLEGYVVSEDAASIRLLKKGFESTGNEAVNITAKQFGGFNGNYIKARFDEEMIIVGTGADQIHTNEETISIKGMARVASGVLAAMLESYRYELVK